MEYRTPFHPSDDQVSKFLAVMSINIPLSCAWCNRCHSGCLLSPSLLSCSFSGFSSCPEIPLVIFPFVSGKIRIRGFISGAHHLFTQPIFPAFLPSSHRPGLSPVDGYHAYKLPAGLTGALAFWEMPTLGTHFTFQLVRPPLLFKMLLTFKTQLKCDLL